MMLTYNYVPTKIRTPEFKLLNFVCIMGFLWCIFEVFPTIMYGNSVACTCDTELCYHDSTVCAMSEISIFVQQSLFWFLTSYIVDAYLLIVKEKRPKDRERMYPLYFAVGLCIPITNLALTVSLASFEEDDPNYHLNALRSAFSCHPQLSTMLEEVLLLYLSTLVCCAIMFSLAVRIAYKVFSAASKTTSAKAALKTVKRLIMMNVFVLFLFAVYLAVTIYYVGIMDDFGTAADHWKLCNEATSFKWPECVEWKGEGYVTYMECLDVNYATRFDEVFEEGCGDRPENAPSVAMMVLAYGMSPQSSVSPAHCRNLFVSYLADLILRCLPPHTTLLSSMHHII